MSEQTSNEITISELTAQKIAELIQSGSINAETLSTLFLDYTEATDKAIHAFAYLDRDSVLMQARLLDEGRARGGDIGRLSGVPIAVKDAFDTFDMPAEYGSKSLAGRQPRWDATAVKKLREAGAVVFGKTKMPDFCLGQAADTCNPHNFEHTPGGSSSGSAAAVAAGMVPVAIGSQTAGSVIRPASFCGVIGFKPTRGLISRAGLQPLSLTLDQVGVFGRDIEDVALVAEVMIGADDSDLTTKGVLPRRLLSVCQQEPPFPPKFAFIRAPFWDLLDPEAKEAFEMLIEALGERITVIDLPEVTKVAIDRLNTIVDAEFAAAMKEHMAHSSEEVSDRVCEIVARGREIKAVDYLKAKEGIEPTVAGFDEFFDRFDAIITPATLGPAPKGLGSTGDPVMNMVWSYTGMPAISLPLLQTESGLPMGIQLVAARHDDARLLRTANWLLKNFDAIIGETS
jgi:Asp-tRNA(Asn)/Glu-tRNA(Gln) amidotransferase A subunit family amidase